MNHNETLSDDSTPHAETVLPQSSLKRFAICLMVAAVSCLLIVGILEFSSFKVSSVEKFFAVDGSFDGPASAAIGAMGKGLPAAAVILFAIAGLWLLFERSSWSPFRLKESTFILLLVGVKLIICVLYIYIFPYEVKTDANYMADDKWYYNAAVQLSQGIDPNTNGRPTAVWPIGYPLLLSVFFRLFGSDIIVAQWVNVLTLVGITLLTYYVGKSLFGAALARRAALVILLMPSQIFFALTIMSDIFQALLTLGLIYLVTQPLKMWRIIIMGLIFGIAILAKPVILFFPLGLALYWRVRGETWRSSLLTTFIILAVGALVILPWQVRNQRDFGRFVLVSTAGGYNLWAGNCPNTNGGTLHPDDFIPKNILRQLDSLNEAESDAQMFKFGMEWIKEHPLTAIKLWYKKFIVLFYEDSKCISRSFGLTYNEVSPTAISTMIFLTEGYYYALGLAFLIGAFKFVRRERWSPRLFLIFGTIIYYIIIHLPFTAEGRYHTVMLPFFAIIAVWLITRITSPQPRKSPP